MLTTLAVTTLAPVLPASQHSLPSLSSGDSGILEKARQLSALVQLEAEQKHLPRTARPSYGLDPLAIDAESMQLSTLEARRDQGLESRAISDDSSAMCSLRTPSPTTSDERLNCAIRAASAQVDPEFLPEGVTPLTPAQRRDSDAGALVFTWSQALQIYLATINTGDLSPPTAQEQLLWLRAGDIIDDGTLWKDALCLQAWHRGILWDAETVEQVPALAPSSL
ncbi:hypothetical protein C8R43DRAFT_941781 [Mycena crocata]|nr:hypothetical protein C8R43DRAFT_941781 [Mycena crocata]